MLPNLSLKPKCIACSDAILTAAGGDAPPIGVLLPQWELRDRQESFTDCQVARMKKNLRDEEDDGSRAECGICYGLLQDPPNGEAEKRAVVLAVDLPDSCGHAFHAQCLFDWFDHQRSANALEPPYTLKCPLCQQPWKEAATDTRYNAVGGVVQRPPPPPPNVPRNVRIRYRLARRARRQQILRLVREERVDRAAVLALRQLFSGWFRVQHIQMDDWFYDVLRAAAQIRSQQDLTDFWNAFYHGR